MFAVLAHVRHTPRKKNNERDREKEREICDFILCDQRVSEYLIHKVKGLTIFIRKKLAYFDQLWWRATKQMTFNSLKHVFQKMYWK